MDLRLHRHGRFRRWLGARLGGDEARGDSAWRRILHCLGATALVYYVVPNDFFVIAPKEWILLLALAAVYFLELLRHLVGLQLPTIRPYEANRIGSFALYSLALAIALVWFPMPIGAAVILGTSIVDPVSGELRAHARTRPLLPVVPIVLYAGLAFVGLALVGHWPTVGSAILAVVAGLLGVAVEGPRLKWIDDDLAMVLVPGVVLWLLAAFTTVLSVGL
jgi:hypothetical protein